MPSFGDNDSEVSYIDAGYVATGSPIVAGTTAATVDIGFAVRYTMATDVFDASVASVVSVVSVASVLAVHCRSGEIAVDNLHAYCEYHTRQHRRHNCASTNICRRNDICSLCCN